MSSVQANQPSTLILQTQAFIRPPAVTAELAADYAKSLDGGSKRHIPRLQRSKNTGNISRFLALAISLLLLLAPAALAQPPAGTVGSYPNAVNLQSTDFVLCYQMPPGVGQTIPSTGATRRCTPPQVVSAGGGGGGGGGSGSVSSVGLSVPSGYGVTGSPVTTSGTLGFTISLPSGTIPYANGSGWSVVTIGSGLSLTGGTLSATGSSGGVTSVGLTMPGGMAVANSPVTAAGTINVTLGTTSGALLYNNAGAFSPVTLGSGLSFTGGTLNTVGGGGVTVTDGSHSVTGATTINVGNGLGVSGTTPSASITPIVPFRTAASPTLAAGDMAGVVYISSGGLTIPGTGVYGTTVLAANMAVTVVNYGSSNAAVSIAAGGPASIASGGGCLTGTGVPPGSSWTLTGNGTTTVDCVQTLGSLASAGTIPNANVAPITFVSGSGSATLVAPRQYYECTAACTLTLPPPQNGYEFCIRNKTNTAAVITLAAIPSVAFELTNQTAYKAVNTAIASGGTITDRVCYVGDGTTAYDVFSFAGTWS